MIDYVLQTTGREKLFYLGHSQGTTSFFVMSTQVPEYQDKIEAMFAMAPIAYCGRMKSPFLQAISHFSNTIDVRKIEITKFKKKERRFLQREIDHRCPIFLLFIERIITDDNVLIRHERIQSQQPIHKQIPTTNVRGKSSHATNMLEYDVPSRWIQSWSARQGITTFSTLV